MVALDSIVTLAVSSVDDLKVVEFTVTPVPENAACSPAPLTKPLPLIAIDWFVAPWPRELGLVEVSVGAALTVKAPVDVAEVVSGLVTVTFREPVAAPAVTEMLAVISVLLTKAVELTVIPVPENEATRPVPLTKFLPLIVIVWLLAP